MPGESLLDPESCVTRVKDHAGGMTRTPACGREGGFGFKVEGGFMYLNAAWSMNEGESPEDGSTNESKAEKEEGRGE